MGDEPDRCPVCLVKWASGNVCKGNSGDALLFECPSCGEFKVSNSALALGGKVEGLTSEQRALLSYEIRRKNEHLEALPLVTTYTVKDLIESKRRLPPPSQQAINAVRFIGDYVMEKGVSLETLPVHFAATIGARSFDLSLDLFWDLYDRNIVSVPQRFVNTSAGTRHANQVNLTLDGWDLYEKERSGQLSGKYGFIALKFGDQTLDPFLKNVIKPAVSSLGFELVDMRDVARSGIIDNLMREQIRDAAFVLVDLTHANRGAYWEAGYAEGLGKPVLYICEREQFNTEGTHFDTNHCTTVLWNENEPEDFSKTLIATLRRSLGLFVA